MLKSFILVKGQPRTFLIEKIEKGNKGLYHVRFKSSTKIYHYKRSDIVWLEKSEWHDYKHCKVYIDGREQHNIADIRSFQQGTEQTHWRITFNNGHVQDYLHGNIQVVESCLSDDIANNAFEYFKSASWINELGKDEDNDALLPALYKKIVEKVRL